MSKLKTFIGILLLSSMLLVNSYAYAQSSFHINLATGFAKGNNHFNVIAKSVAGTKLELYVNDKNPTKATVNKQDWATFRNVTLVGSGKISFTRVLQNGRQQPINYTRQYQVTGEVVQFSATSSIPKSSASTTPAPTPTVEKPVVNAPATTPAVTPTPASTPSVTSTPSCTPLSDEGKCYEPGEYCRDADAGLTGVAGDGDQITCTDNDGLRWEPS